MQVVSKREKFLPFRAVLETISGRGNEPPAFCAGLNRISVSNNSVDSLKQMKIAAQMLNVSKQTNPARV